MSDTCTRAWYATYTACLCPPCTRQRSRVRKMIHANMTTRVPATEAIAIIAEMIEKDWNGAAIASACRISLKTARAILYDVRAGRPRRISAGNTMRIINHGEPTAGSIGATPSLRKLRALTRNGHTLEAMAAKSGLQRQTLARIRNGDVPKIGTGTAAAVHVAWMALRLTPGNDVRAIQRATRNGWPGVGDWDDIDDIRERAWTASDEDLATERDQAILELHARGLDPDEIRVEIGCHRSTVARVLGEAA